MTLAGVRSSAVLIALLPSGAMADVTPQQVWQSWQAMLTSAGQELAVGAIDDTGDKVEVNDIQVAYKDPLGGSASVSFDRLTFADNGDGTVSVTMPDSYPMQMAFPDDAEGPSSIKLTVTQEAMRIVAGGSETEVRYDFTVPMARIVLDEVIGQGGTVLDTTGDMTMTGATGNYLVSRSADTVLLDSRYQAKSVIVTLSGSDNSESGWGFGSLAMTLGDLSGETKGNFLNAEMMANMAAALNAGFTMDSRFTFGAMTMSVDITEASGPTKLSANATGGGFTLALNKDQLNYGTALNGAKLVVSGAEIPFPQVELAFAESGFNLLMPVTKSETPQDFAFLTKLVDFTVSEDVWGLFDPAGSLSREPATVVVDLKGTGFWTEDIMDPAVQAAGAEPPGELHSLDVTQLLARGAGAEVSATGGLTFDNTDLVTFGGAPRPDGKITVGIKGANQLVENLIALGILTEDDALGFRMGLAMFARPGAGPDELTSEIEFRDGGLFANGQQLQ